MTRPLEPKSEYAVDPLGVDVARPRFSWLLESSERGQMQSAYQILVASSKEKLQASRRDKWDSGKVASDESVNVPYEGSPLASGERCWWKVRVRAVGAVTVLIGPDDERGGLLGRMGMQAMPYRNPLGRFGEFWENFYSWALLWTYNPASLHHRRLLTMRRREFWISAEAFVARYGPTPVRTPCGTEMRE